MEVTSILELLSSARLANDRAKHILSTFRQLEQLLTGKVDIQRECTYNELPSYVCDSINDIVDPWVVFIKQKPNRSIETGEFMRYARMERNIFDGITKDRAFFAYFQQTLGEMKPYHLTFYFPSYTLPGCMWMYPGLVREGRVVFPAVYAPVPREMFDAPADVVAARLVYVRDTPQPLEQGVGTVLEEPYLNAWTNIVTTETDEIRRHNYLFICNVLCTLYEKSEDQINMLYRIVNNEKNAPPDWEDVVRWHNAVFQLRKGGYVLRFDLRSQSNELLPEISKENTVVFKSRRIESPVESSAVSPVSLTSSASSALSALSPPTIDQPQHEDNNIADLFNVMTINGRV